MWEPSTWTASFIGSSRQASGLYPLHVNDQPTSIVHRHQLLHHLLSPTKVSCNLRTSHYLLAAHKLKRMCKIPVIWRFIHIRWFVDLSLLEVSLDATPPNVCFPCKMCIYSCYNLDLWPFQQCPLTWWIFVASFIKITPLSRDIVSWKTGGWTTVGQHNAFTSYCAAELRKLLTYLLTYHHLATSHNYQIITHHYDLRSTPQFRL